MPEKLITILGLSPGTRSFGFAIISDGELVDWGVKGFKGKWTVERPEKMRLIIQNFISQYQVDRLAIKISLAVQKTKNVDKVTALLIELAKKNNLPLSQYTIRNLKQVFSGSRNKRDLVKSIRTYFPELNSSAQTEPHDPYIRQYEAVAVSISDIKNNG